jgi:integrase
VIRRMLNVAVRKKFLFANPCAGVEFPARVDGLFRPHYVTWSEQQKIEFSAPDYLRNVIRIVTETGLRIYKELTPMKKEQLDLGNGTGWIPDSKTPNGVAEVPLTEIAVEAFRKQFAISGPSQYLFPSDESADGYQKTSGPFGVRLCDGRVFDTSAFTISVRRTPRGSAPVALRTSGSRSCSGKGMRRCSRNTRK